MQRYQIMRLPWVRQEAEECKTRSASWEGWTVSLKKHCALLDGQAVTRGMALELIQSIRVSGYNDLEIIWNFRDEIARMDKMAALAENGEGAGS